MGVGERRQVHNPLFPAIALQIRDLVSSFFLIVPWNPEATLIPPTTAPLASRISIPPLASQMPASKRPTPLEQMSLELQEASILEDLLFVFMVRLLDYVRI